MIALIAKTIRQPAGQPQGEIDLAQNKITNLTKNEQYSMKPFPELIAKIVEAGGLLHYKP